MVWLSGLALCVLFVCVFGSFLFHVSLLHACVLIEADRCACVVCVAVTVCLC